MFTAIIRAVWPRKWQSSSKLGQKKSKEGDLVSSDEGEPEGEDDADKTATQEVPSKEIEFSKIISIVGTDVLVSLGFDKSFFYGNRTSSNQLFTGLPQDIQNLLAIKQEMKNKYKSVVGPPTVRMWLDRAEELIFENIKVRRKSNRRSRYCVGMMIKTCLQLVMEGSLLNVYPDIAHTPHSVLPIPAHPFVGQWTAFDRVVELLRPGNNNSTIGIYGMGAVGKTALMQRVNNYLALTYDFHIVIWVHVSRGDDILLRVQRDILSRLGLPCSEDRGQNQKSIRSSLLPLRFVLLLDELWEKLDLQEVGLPTSHTRKVVFTTRSKEVCTEMNAYKTIRVDFLVGEEAHKLLQNYVGFKEPSLANSVVDGCRGLPLALVIAGKHLKHNNGLENW